VIIQVFLKMVVKPVHVCIYTLNYFCAGTIITEWDAGKQLCAEFLNSETESHAFADQLVDIAVQFGFDGWLLNIENDLQVTSDQEILLFDLIRTVKRRDISSLLFWL